MPLQHTKGSKYPQYGEFYFPFLLLRHSKVLSIRTRYLDGSKVFYFYLHFLCSVLPVWVRGHLLVLLEHGLLQSGVSADSLDQGTQETMQEAGEEERQRLSQVPSCHCTEWPQPRSEQENLLFHCLFYKMSLLNQSMHLNWAWTISEAENSFD